MFGVDIHLRGVDILMFGVIIQLHGVSIVMFGVIIVMFGVKIELSNIAEVVIKSGDVVMWRCGDGGWWFKNIKM